MADRSLAHLVGRLDVLASSVGAAVERRRAAEPGRDDPFRGLDLGDEEIDHLLAGDVPGISPEAGAAAAYVAVDRRAVEDEAAGHDMRLLSTARRFGLDPVDLGILLVVAAPDVDSRFERLYGYLHDDVTRRRASVGLALELCGLHPAAAGARRRLSAVGALVEGRLVVVDDADRPFLTRALRVPDRVTAHLLGGDDPDPLVADLLTEPVPVELADGGALAAAISRLVASAPTMRRQLTETVTPRRTDEISPGAGGPPDEIAIALTAMRRQPTETVAPRRTDGGEAAAAGTQAGGDKDGEAHVAAERRAATETVAPRRTDGGGELGAGAVGGLGWADTHGDGGEPGLGGGGDALVYVVEPAGASGRSYAAAGLAAAGWPVLVADLDRLATHDLAATARAMAREVRLRGAALVAGPIEALAGSPDANGGGGDRDGRAIRCLAELPGVVVLVGRSTWDPQWAQRVPLLVTAPLPTLDERARSWRAHLDGHLAPGVDAALSTAHFRLTPEQVAGAARAAVNHASLDGTPVGEEAIRVGARSRNGAGLERRARRIEPGVGWDDLVLPPGCLAGLQEMAARVRHREQVLRTWSMRPGGGRGHGITALFAGDSGTGKTMSAEVVAGHLGLDLYVVDLATVVDKYVGETEKNLDRIFDEASGVNGVLLFDEADALFGKRSEVRDAHDRYANIEVAFLLQRMETFDGLAILTTNMRANVDEAFTRRLDAIVDFPLPDETQRRLLWARCLGPDLPRSDDVDLDFCADRFELSGGNIRSITLTAAYLAADRGAPVTMADLMRATQREYRKLGRLCVRSEFGPWLDVGAAVDA